MQKGIPLIGGILWISSIVYNWVQENLLWTQRKPALAKLHVKDEV